MPKHSQHTELRGQC